MRVFWTSWYISSSYRFPHTVDIKLQRHSFWYFLLHSFHYGRSGGGSRGVQGPGSRGPKSQNQLAFSDTTPPVWINNKMCFRRGSKLSGTGANFRLLHPLPSFFVSLFLKRQTKRDKMRDGWSWKHPLPWLLLTHGRSFTVILLRLRYSLRLSPCCGVVNGNSQDATAGCGCAPPGDESAVLYHTHVKWHTERFSQWYWNRIRILTVEFWLGECEDLTCAPGPESEHRKQEEWSTVVCRS